MTTTSKAQIGFMLSQNPKLAKEFAKKTVDMKHLPQHADKKPMMKPKLSTT